jgi:ATP-dependent helicase/nuclease subunit A
VVEAGFAQADIAPWTGRVALDGDGTALRYGVDPRLAAASAGEPAQAPALPGWASRLAPAEPAGVRFAAPSQLGEEAGPPAPSPLARTLGLGRYRRGEIVHRLLQLLPDVAPAARRDAARRVLARELDLSDAQREEMTAAALGVLEDPQFAAVFGPGSRAEIALAGGAGLPAGLAISGRVDRLLVEADRVLVADFKTNRPAPASIEAADRAYVRQLAVYWAVLQSVFPGRRVEAALIWTDGPRLMAVPENLMRRALDELGRSG